MSYVCGRCEKRGILYLIIINNELISGKELVLLYYITITLGFWRRQIKRRRGQRVGGRRKESISN
jgi:hypothetical protein